MPIYDFRCQECGQVAEFLLSSPSDNRPLDCPSCGSQRLERQISTFNVVSDRANAPGTTCCGRTERCQTSPCSTGGRCARG